jgi:hypothetical protein
MAIAWPVTKAASSPAYDDRIEAAHEPDCRLANPADVVNLRRIAGFVAGFTVRSKPLDGAFEYRRTPT